MIPIQAVIYANPDGYPPIINGARVLAAHGFSMDIFCRETRESWNIAYPENVRVHRIRARAKNSKLQYAEFVSNVLLRANRKAPLFIGHDLHGFFPARLLATTYNRPLVYQSHELVDKSVSLPLAPRLLWKFQRRFAKSANLIILPDADRLRIMSDELDLERTPLVVANAPLRRVLPSGERIRNELSERGYIFDKIVFRQSNIGPGHAIETTIRSMPIWNNTNWGFVVMGPCREDYRLSLQKLASEVGVSERFVVLPPVAYDEVADFTLGAHIGHSLYTAVDLNNQFNATASNKLLEYMAAGLPLIVSDRPRLRALVEKYQCGLTADEGSPESIADSVNTLLSDPQKTYEMGRAGRRTFEQEFCFERQFAPVVDIISKLAFPNGKGTPS